MSWRNMIGNLLIIGMRSALLWHFANIWRYGQYLIQEPNMVIKILETSGLLAIFVFGVSKFVVDMRR